MSIDKRIRFLQRKARYKGIYLKGHTSGSFRGVWPISCILGVQSVVSDIRSTGTGRLRTREWICTSATAYPL